MRILALSLFVSAPLFTLALSACSAKPPEQPLPPAGLAGAPSASGTAAPIAPQPSSIPVSPGDALPSGHPPVGGDDGAPIKPRDPSLPNFGNVGAGGSASAGGAGGSGPNATGQGVLTGTIVEKLDVPTYTYMRVKLSSGTEEWIAVTTAPVKVGDKVTVNQQIVMENFPSKSLNRTFPRLVMGTLAGAGK